MGKENNPEIEYIGICPICKQMQTFILGHECIFDMTHEIFTCLECGEEFDEYDILQITINKGEKHAKIF